MNDTKESLRDQYGLEVETVADVIGDEPAPPPARFALARLEDSPEPFGPGIYFGMDEDTYHAAPALSAGGIKKLAASPMIYWATCSWLNPEFAEWKKEQEEKRKKDGADHFDVGHAYHCRILEGKEAFDARYCGEVDKADHPKALVTIDDIKAAFPEGLKPKGKSKAEMFASLAELDGTAELWDDIKAAHAAANPGKTMIAAKVRKQLEIAAAMIERDEGLADMIRGGHPEVSLFWTCPRTGIPKKARVDLLKIDMMVDLKTYQNMQDKSPERAITAAIANNRYGLQPSHYFEGAKEVRKLLREFGTRPIHFPDDHPSRAEFTDWAMRWAAHQEPDEWAWIFQQKGVAPITRGVMWPRGGVYKGIFDDICLSMSKRFRQFNDVYETAPWLDTRPVYDLADEDLPPWSTEI